MEFDKLRPKLVMILGEQTFQNIILSAQLEETTQKLQEANKEITRLNSQKGDIENANRK
ncbi:hypothetical protein [Dehalobacter restrictus]|uniref:hypothetical protein n=1 Tax=Dehalobacter restrictus TaxID=55583 RepID=UPI00338F5E3D